MKNNQTYKLIPILGSFFVMGFCDIVGISSDYVQRSFGWSSTMTGFVPSMVFIWFLFLSIPVGNLMNRFGRKNTVLLSMLVTVIGMFMPLVYYNSTVCVLAFMLLGIGNAILQVSLNPLLNNVVQSPRQLTSCMTAGQVIKAVSSLVGPEILLWVTFCWGEAYWYYCFPVLGAVTLLFAFVLMLTPVAREASSQERISLSDSFGLLRDKTILLLFLGIFFVVGVDVAMNYISSKLMDVRFGWEPDQAKYAPQVYFLSRTVGALIGTFLLSKIASRSYFRVNITACALALAVLMAVSHPLVNLLCIGAVGFFASSVFSIIYSMAFEARPDRMNQVSGLMITAVAGGGIVTPLIGWALDCMGIVAGLSIILLCVFYLVFCAYRVRVNS